MKMYDVIVVGGGLAGLTAALHLKKEGFTILLIEKHNYPNHKVCGEYVSNEVKPYFSHLGIAIDELDAVDINTLQMSTKSGKSIKTKLPYGGFGISRYTLDNHLYTTASTLGVDFVFDTVNAISYNTDRFSISTSTKKVYHAKTTIGAFGKRSNLDKKLERKFIQQKSPWLGVKCHYEYKNFPSNLVSLHNFPGGYGGLSKIENGNINFCYLTSYKSFKKYNSIEAFNESQVSKNPFLQQFLNNATPVYSKPLSIAQISFEKKETVTNHMLLCGDCAGLIHPLCGNGMAMAIHSAKIASECIIHYLKNPTSGRTKMEQTYNARWKKEFNSRLQMGRLIQRVLLNNTASEITLHSIAKSEKILQTMIKRTHGNPILV